MIYKRFTWALALLQIFVSCQNNRKQHTTDPIAVPKEYFTLYSKTDEVLKVVRFLSLDGKDLIICNYKVDFSRPEQIQQTFDTIGHITQKQSIQIKNKLKNEYNWEPSMQNQVLFVQLQSKGFKDEVQMLDMRQDIETEIGDALEKRKSGEWVAGDLGPGGGNMLYEIKSVNAALPIILNVLKEKNLDKNVIIGRRVMTKKDDWFYEVIYPMQFSGEFNTM